MIDQMQLAAFRQSLPENQRYEIHRFFVVRWDIVKARFMRLYGQRRAKRKTEHIVKELELQAQTQKGGEKDAVS